MSTQNNQEPEETTVKVMMGHKSAIGDDLDYVFSDLFEHLCKAGIPILGFSCEPCSYDPDDRICYIWGGKQCFSEVFAGFPLFIAKMTDYIQNTSDDFWLAQLHETDPMKSKLVKYTKK